MYVGSYNNTYECLKLCQRTEGCNWSSFNERYESCHLFENCFDIITDGYEEHATSHVECNKVECGLTGFCKVRFKKFLQRLKKYILLLHKYP